MQSTWPTHVHRHSNQPSSRDLQPLPSFSPPPHCESHCLFPWQPVSLNKWDVLLFTARCWDMMQGGKKMQINETTSCHEQACAHVLWMTLQIHAHFTAAAIHLVIHYSIKENQLLIILNSLQIVKCACSTKFKGLPCLFVLYIKCYVWFAMFTKEETWRSGSVS